MAESRELFLVSSISRSQHIVRHVARNVVPRPDFVHLLFVLGDVIAVVLCSVFLELLVNLIEPLLIVRRQPSLILPEVGMRRIPSCYGVERCIRRDTVALHNFSHVARVLGYVVPVVLGVRFLPLCIFLVELVLIVPREPSLPTVGIATVVVGTVVVWTVVICPVIVAWGILRRDLFVRPVRRNRILIHQVLHMMFHADHVIAVTGLFVLHPA